MCVFPRKPLRGRIVTHTSVKHIIGSLTTTNVVATHLRPDCVTADRGLTVITTTTTNPPHPNHTSTHNSATSTTTPCRATWFAPVTFLALTLDIEQLYHTHIGDAVMSKTGEETPTAALIGVSDPDAEGIRHVESSKAILESRYPLVDVRTRAERLGNLGYVPTSFNVVLSDIQAATSADEMTTTLLKGVHLAHERTYGEAGGDIAKLRSFPIIVLCRSGKRSMAAARALVAAGYTNVINLDGGQMAWQECGAPNTVVPEDSGTDPVSPLEFRDALKECFVDSSGVKAGKLSREEAEKTFTEAMAAEAGDYDEPNPEGFEGVIRLLGEKARLAGFSTEAIAGHTAEFMSMLSRVRSEKD